MFQILTEVPEAKLELRELDLSSLESVRKFAKEINDTVLKLDILINNAGNYCCSVNNISSTSFITEVKNCNGVHTFSVAVLICRQTLMCFLLFDS